MGVSVWVSCKSIRKKDKVGERFILFLRDFNQFQAAQYRKHQLLNWVVVCLSGNQVQECQYFFERFQSVSRYPVQESVISELGGCRLQGSLDAQNFLGYLQEFEGTCFRKH